MDDEVAPVAYPTACDWPEEPHYDVLISMDGGETTFCLYHDDDMLPVLEPGRNGGCVLCGKTCTTWIIDEDPGVCLHEECRRDRALRRLPHRAVGAYARRERQL